MNAATTAAAYAALYGPTAVDLARSMSEVGTALSAQLDAFSTQPTEGEAEALVRNLEGAARAVRRVHEALRREAGP